MCALTIGLCTQSAMDHFDSGLRHSSRCQIPQGSEILTTGVASPVAETCCKGHKRRERGRPHETTAKRSHYRECEKRMRMFYCTGEKGRECLGAAQPIMSSGRRIAAPEEFIVKRLRNDPIGEAN